MTVMGVMSAGNAGAQISPDYVTRQGVQAMPAKVVAVQAGPLREHPPESKPVPPAPPPVAPAPPAPNVDLLYKITPSGID